jgi:hypothetical protein
VLLEASESAIGYGNLLAQKFSSDKDINFGAAGVLSYP